MLYNVYGLGEKTSRTKNKDDVRRVSSELSATKGKENLQRMCVSGMAMGTNPIPKASANIHAKAQVEKAGGPIPEIPLVRYPEWGAPAILHHEIKASKPAPQASQPIVDSYGRFLEENEREKEANEGKNSQHQTRDNRSQQRTQPPRNPQT
jgi:hypothetical protein